MLFLIEGGKVQRAEIHTQLAEVKPIVFSNLATNAEETDQLEKKLRDSINELSQTLTKAKLDKFKRDQHDYDENAVYTWQKHSRFPRKLPAVTSSRKLNLTSMKVEL